ncbi:hypothetical protein A0J57_13955 [Sphingobium sp. 22B]|nr:hypothetical protein AXW74_15060 [Sphingobium sp. AM]KYC31722.1 hypothetical protein A0J57_13955 [Sphingobium sp. 22B]OAP31044.1 hypothetical protein A8O16_15340 [Sphingobium sp. 20006FA]
MDAESANPIEGQRFAWLPVRSGDYSKDCAAGEAAARELLAVARDTDNPILILSAIRNAVEGGEWSAFEIGFATTICVAAL